MLLKGFVILIGIFVFSILTILCLVFAVIYIVGAKPGKFGWLAGFFLSLLALVTCIFLLVAKVSAKAKEFSDTIENKFTPNFDAEAYDDYNLADSVNSKQIQYLKALDTVGIYFNPPLQFYNYLGFRDYFRMPLRYPYAIHCSDSLYKGNLFDEIDVQKFDVNDNGEKDCHLNNIVAFAFDKNYMLIKTSELKSGKEEIQFLIFNFDSQDIERFKTLEQLTKRAKERDFSSPIQLLDCKTYYELF